MVTKPVLRLIPASLDELFKPKKDNHMAAKLVELPSKTFSKQGDAQQYFKSMLNRYEDGDYLNSDDEDLLYELLQRHPDAEKKNGVGVRAFFRQKSADHPTSCFHILRVDGSITDFGYGACVTGRAPGLRHAFYEACRRSVVAPLMQQKQHLFDVAGGSIRCFKTGELTSIHSSEYRHTEPKFRDIVSSFVQAKNIAIVPSMMTVSQDMQYQTVFTDPAMARDFIDFHATLAKLEIFKKHER